MLRRILTAAAAAMVLVGAVVSVAAAQSDEEETPQADTFQVEPLEDAEVDAVDDDMFFEGPDDGDWEDWEPTAEELAEVNAETDALVEYLQGLGFDVT
ncbi:MAG: hypothetical protein GY722_29950, partial [bacterium]|nr:hypothetical protein [bacterium]